MHLLKRLCTPNATLGAPAVTLKFLHTNVPSTLPPGWLRLMKEAHGRGVRLYAITAICTYPDEACAHYNAWVESKSASEDDAEAEKLRNEDLKEAGA